MSRPVLALVFLAIFFGLNFGLRTWLHLRRTGTTGFRGISGRIGSAEWFGGLLFTIGLVLGVAAPLAELAGVVNPVIPERPWWVDVAAGCLVVFGISGIDPNSAARPR